MHRIDGAGNVNNLFVAEDVATSRPPTEFTPEWFNAVQEEVATFIEWALGVLDKADNTQLRRGLLAKFASWDVVDSVITSAGLVVNHADPTLLRQAVAKMIQSGQRSVIINGATFAGAVTGTGKAVYWDSANSRFDLAIADGTNKQNCVGFADVANANVYAFGDAVLFAGLTPGARYYLDGETPGAINITSPVNGGVIIGIARTATELFVDIDTQTSVAAALQGAFRNLTGSATGLSALATYAVDELTTGDGAGNYQTLRAWAGSITMTTLGTNGLDVGAVAASTWYYAYGISKPDGTKAFIASLSATGPSLANTTGYTKWARIGAFRTDGTANKYPLGFKQAGRRCGYKVAAGSNVAALPQMASISALTMTAIGIGAYVPPTALEIIVNCSGTVCNAAIVAPNADYSVSTLGPTAQSSNANSGTGVSSVAQIQLLLESSNIYGAVSGGSGAFWANGWIDNL